MTISDPRQLRAAFTSEEERYFARLCSGLRVHRDNPKAKVRQLVRTTTAEFKDRLAKPEQERDALTQMVAMQLAMAGAVFVRNKS